MGLCTVTPNPIASTASTISSTESSITSTENTSISFSSSNSSTRTGGQPAEESLSAPSRPLLLSNITNASNTTRDEKTLEQPQNVTTQNPVRSNNAVRTNRQPFDGQVLLSCVYVFLAVLLLGNMMLYIWWYILCRKNLNLSNRNTEASNNVPNTFPMNIRNRQ